MHRTVDTAEGRRWRNLRLQQDLRNALLTVVELPVHLRSVVQGDAVGDDPARIGAPLDDHVPKLTVVLLDVTLTRPEACPFSKRRPKSMPRRPCAAISSGAPGSSGT